MNITIAPSDIHAGSRYRVTYMAGNTHLGTAVPRTGDVGHDLLTKDGKHRLLTVREGQYVRFSEQVTGIESVDEQSEIDDRTHEERVEATVHQAAVEEVRQLREAHRREADRCVTAEDELVAFKKQVSELLVSIAEAERVAEPDVSEAIEDWHSILGLEPPKPEPVTVEYTITLTAKVTPASREVANTLESGDPSFLLEDALTGLDSLDFDSDTFEVDPYKGIDVEVYNAEVN